MKKALAPTPVEQTHYTLKKSVTDFREIFFGRFHPILSIAYGESPSPLTLPRERNFAASLLISKLKRAASRLPRQAALFIFDTQRRKRNVHASPNRRQSGEL
ncbi:MAG: hypothetical protein WBY44_18320 [Bryobacteraceae bacterium]